MIYFCADDYGLNDISSMHIQECIENGILNKVSVFPNFENINPEKIQNTRISLHLNLVEGRCMSEGLNLLADRNGNFIHTFGGLFKLNLLKRKQLEDEAYKEIKAQVLHFKNMMPEGAPFCIDSHQHTHMIPAIFKALVKVIEDEEIKVEYMRIPAEPVIPFIKTPSLYFTYSPINIIKQWLLKFLWLVNKKQASLPTALFFGILFSGKMDEKRVSKIMPKYIKLAEKKGMDIEVLFHPGYMDEKTNLKNIVFEKFYLSENRKTEFDSLIKISERSVL